MATLNNHSESSDPLGNQVDTRELRFRAWNGTAMYWPDYIVNDEGGFPMNQTGGEELSDAFQTEEHPLMQFTGLKNNNGKDIYEGDLFSAWDNRSYYVVEWNEQRAGFHLIWIRGAVGDSKMYHYFDMLMAEYQFEPVGNVFENPELLTNVTTAASERPNTTTEAEKNALDAPPAQLEGSDGK